MTEVTSTRPASASWWAEARPAAPVKLPLWERPAFYRYGFLLIILVVWELVAPFINPIFFTSPTAIAAAFYAPATFCSRHFASKAHPA